MVSLLANRVLIFYEEPSGDEQGIGVYSWLEGAGKVKGGVIRLADV
jgi:hypothetical protein